jgi:hypothetical protein
MPIKEFKQHYDAFSELIHQVPTTGNEQMDILINRYMDQNLVIMNDVFNTSIENLKRLQRAQNPNDVICIQARFTNEISKKLAMSAQRFLNASLGHIADYNEWLKAHCDLATD